MCQKKRENVWKKIKKRKNISKTNTILKDINKISQKNCKKKLEKLWRKFNNGNNLSIQVKDQNLCNKIKKAEIVNVAIRENVKNRCSKTEKITESKNIYRLVPKTETIYVK